MEKFNASKDLKEAQDNALRIGLNPEIIEAYTKDIEELINLNKKLDEELKLWT